MVVRCNNSKIDVGRSRRCRASWLCTGSPAWHSRPVWQPRQASYPEGLDHRYPGAAETSPAPLMRPSDPSGTQTQPPPPTTPVKDQGAPAWTQWRWSLALGEHVGWTCTHQGPARDMMPMPRPPPSVPPPSSPQSRGSVYACQSFPKPQPGPRSACAQGPARYPVSGAKNDPDKWSSCPPGWHGLHTGQGHRIASLYVVSVDDSW